MLRAGAPTHICPTQSPDTNPTAPSTTNVLGWSRDSQPRGLESCGRFCTRTSTPAARSFLQNPREAFPKPPSQS